MIAAALLLAACGRDAPEPAEPAAAPPPEAARGAPAEAPKVRTLRTLPPGAADGDVRITAASLLATTLHVEAVVRNDGASAATARLALVSLAGAEVAYAEELLAAGKTATLRLDVELAFPFDVVEHRVVASRAGDAEVVRTVAPLGDRVGDTDVRLRAARALGAAARAAPRVVVRNSRSGEAVAGAPVELRLLDLAGAEIARAASSTDAWGTADLAFDLPQDAPAECFLRVSARDALSSHVVSAPVRVRAALSGHLLLDLPVHRPGDAVRVRAIVTHQPSGRPAEDAALRVALVDPLGTTSAAIDASTGRFGVVEATLPVPAPLPPLDFRVQVLDGERVVAETPLRIETLDEPPFRISVAPATRSIRPRGALEARVVATDFDGSPVARATVTVALGTGDPEVTPISAWEGLTADDGGADVAFRVPAKARRDLGRGLFLEVTVADAEGRVVRDWARLAWTRTGNPADVLLPDGPLAPGMPGRVLVRTALPQGAEVTAGVPGALAVRSVDELGFVELPILDPQPGASIAVGPERFDLAVSEPPLTLALARRLVGDGEPLRIRAHCSTAAPAVFVDLLRESCAVATFALPLVDGHAEADLAVPDGIAGPITVQAYVLPDVTEHVVARSSFVIPRERLRIHVTPSTPCVAPGQPVALDVRVTDMDGRGVASAIGLRVADEAVMSLGPAPPPCARATRGTGPAQRDRIDGRTGTSLADLVATAGRRALSTAETRLVDVLLTAEDRPEWYGRGVGSLHERKAEHLRRVADLMDEFAQQFHASAMKVVATQAPPPSAQTPFLAAALADASASGAFGRDGLLDPWGSPIQILWVGDPPPFHFVAGDTATGTFAPLLLRSAGPDGESNSPDDTEARLSCVQTAGLHGAWVEAHGHSFDASAFSPRMTGDLVRRSGALDRGPRKRRPYFTACYGSLDRDPPRMRRFYADAALFAPLVLTDADGNARVEFTAPDWTTAWRVDAVAFDADGNAADASTSFRTEASR